MHLGAGYDSTKTHELLEGFGYQGQITSKGMRLQVTERWSVEQTNAGIIGKFASWRFELKDGRDRALVALVNAIVILTRLLAEIWTWYR